LVKKTLERASFSIDIFLNFCYIFTINFLPFQPEEAIMPITKEEYLAVWKDGTVAGLELVAHDPDYWGFDREENIFVIFGYEVDEQGEPLKPYPDGDTDIDVARLRTKKFQDEYFSTITFEIDDHRFSAPTDDGFYINCIVHGENGPYIDKDFIAFKDIKQITDLGYLPSPPGNLTEN
jgi:hypothetical protein